MAAQVGNENVKALYNHLRTKFIDLKLDSKQFESEVKESTYDSDAYEISDIYYLLKNEGTNSLNRKLLENYDSFESKLRLLQLFNQFDSDHNKKLSKKEFEKALKTMNFTKIEISSLFAQFDSDNNQTLSLKEFVKAFDVFLKSARSAPPMQSRLSIPLKPTLTVQRTEVITAIGLDSFKSQKSVQLTKNVELEVNKSEINEFISKIGKKIKVNDSHDNEIIQHLIEYIRLYERDTSKYNSLISQMDEQFSELEGQYWEMKDNMEKLKGTNEVNEQIVRQQSEDLRQLSHEIGSPRGDIGLLKPGSGNNSLDPVMELQQSISNNLSQSIASQEKQLELLESEIAHKKLELTGYKNTMETIADLEKKNDELTNTLDTTQTLLNGRIQEKQRENEEQRNAIDSQMRMITSLTDQIRDLESYIQELKESLGKEDYNMNELQKALYEKDKIIKNAQLGRQESLNRTINFVAKSIGPIPNMVSLKSDFEYDMFDNSLGASTGGSVVGIGVDSGTGGTRGSTGSGGGGGGVTFGANPAMSAIRSELQRLQEENSAFKVKIVELEALLEDAKSKNDSYGRSNDGGMSEEKVDANEIDPFIANQQMHNFSIDTMSFGSDERLISGDKVNHVNKRSHTKLASLKDEAIGEELGGYSCVLFGYPLC